MKKFTIALVITPAIISVIVAIFLTTQFEGEILGAFLTLSFIYFAVNVLLIFLPYFLIKLKDSVRSENSSEHSGWKKATQDGKQKENRDTKGKRKGAEAFNGSDR